MRFSSFPELYGRVIVPDVVMEELQFQDAPEKVRNWAFAVPAWVEVLPAPTKPLPTELHRGEAAAIVLAGELGANLLLLDDKDARKYAEARGFRVTGVLGVVRDAARILRSFDWEAALTKLQWETNHRATPSLYADVAAEIRRSASS